MADASDLFGRPERAQLLKHSAQGLEHRPAAVAAREVPPHAGEVASLELAVEVVGDPVARLVTGRDPGFQEEVQHVCLDAERGAFVSGSYDLGMAPGEQPDAELVRRAQDGDLDAFAEIVHRHERRLRIVLLRILDDARDVEEAVQDAFVQAWRNLDGYRGDAALFTWLYRIGVNAALARTRRKEPVVVDIALLEGVEATAVRPEHRPEAAAEAGYLRSLVVSALAELPFEYREAVVLRDVAGLSNTEVAAALGVSVAAAKSRIHRGRLQLRDLLEGHGNG